MEGDLGICKVCDEDLWSDEWLYETKDHQVHKECADRFLNDDLLDYYCEHGVDPSNPCNY